MDDISLGDISQEQVVDELRQDLIGQNAHTCGCHAVDRALEER